VNTELQVNIETGKICVDLPKKIPPTSSWQKQNFPFHI